MTSVETIPLVAAQTPPLMCGEPPELVPLEDGACPATPPRVVPNELKFKAFTPAPKRSNDYGRQSYGSHTPQPNMCNDLTNDEELQSMFSSLVMNEKDAEVKSPVAATRTPQVEQTAQYTAPPANPGMLYPVYEDGRLMGYMAVPTNEQPPVATMPESSYAPMPFGGMQETMQALTEINVNQTHQRRGKEHQGNGAAEEWVGDASGLDILSLRGKLIEIARDHAGSRALQKRLDRGCSDEEKQAIFDEVQPQCEDLMVHMFGNYVVQKLFEHGLPHHVEVLSEKLRGNVLALTLSPYGCRVIQKALESVDQGYKKMVVEELTGHVPRCVQDQNGNHVIQKCIEMMPGKVGFIVEAFSNNVQMLAMHAYGCRVIQRLLEFCKKSTKVEPIIQEVLSSVDQLVGDRYGNYVVQHVIINGAPEHRAFILGKLKGSSLSLARGKFSSNVVEKMFEYGSHDERTEMLLELLQVSTPDGISGLLAMVQDPFANYVVQKMLDCCKEEHQRMVTEHIRPHVAQLKKFNYGKHIITRLEKAGMSFYSPPQQPHASHYANNYSHPQRGQEYQGMQMGAMGQQQGYGDMRFSQHTQRMQ